MSLSEFVLHLEINRTRPKIDINGVQKVNAFFVSEIDNAARYFLHRPYSFEF